MTLEQRWERTFTTQNSYSQANKAVDINILIPAETLKICGHEAVQVEKNDETRVVWFGTIDTDKGAENRGGAKQTYCGKNDMRGRKRWVD